LQSSRRDGDQNSGGKSWGGHHKLGQCSGETQHVLRRRKKEKDGLLQSGSEKRAKVQGKSKREKKRVEYGKPCD